MSELLRKERVLERGFHHMNPDCRKGEEIENENWSLKNLF